MATYIHHLPKSSSRSAAPIVDHRDHSGAAKAKKPVLRKGPEKLQIDHPLPPLSSRPGAKSRIPPAKHHENFVHLGGGGEGADKHITLQPARSWICRSGFLRSRGTAPGHNGDHRARTPPLGARATIVALDRRMKP